MAWLPRPLLFDPHRSLDAMPTTALPTQAARPVVRSAAKPLPQPSRAPRPPGLDWKTAFVRTLLRRFPAMNPDHADEVADAAAAEGLDQAPERAAGAVYVRGWSERERANPTPARKA
jgi:hypothetical protein